MGDSVHRHLGEMLGTQQWLGWYPLRNVNDAFGLIKGLHEQDVQGFRLFGPANLGPAKDPNWCAGFYGLNDGVACACSLDPARCITLACLKAVGVETE